MAINNKTRRRLTISIACLIILIIVGIVKRNSIGNHNLQTLKLRMQAWTQKDQPAARKVMGQVMLNQNAKVLQVDSSKGFLALVSPVYALPDSYNPSLVNAYEKRKKGALPLANSSIEMQEIVLLAVQDMFAQAKEEGVDGFIVTSGYRSVARQQELYNNATLREKDGVTLVAKPHHSEHETGLALDITCNDMRKDADSLTFAFGDTVQGIWLAQNAWRFGFIVRYPKGKESITGIGYEPWHFRYVGFPHAQIITMGKMCLEEYMDSIPTDGYLEYTASDKMTYQIYRVTDANNIVPPQGEFVAQGDNMGGAVVTCLQSN